MDIGVQKGDIAPGVAFGVEQRAEHHGRVTTSAQALRREYRADARRAQRRRLPAEFAVVGLARRDERAAVAQSERERTALRVRRRSNGAEVACVTFESAAVIPEPERMRQDLAHVLVLPDRFESHR